MLGSIVFTVVAGLAAARLQVRADFSYLLPQSVRSVQDLRAIERRARVIGSAEVAVEDFDASAVYIASGFGATLVPRHTAERRRAALMLRDKIEGLSKDLVSGVTFDHSIERKYAWDHRWLFAKLDDLTRARDALADEIRRAKLDANPAYVDLEDPAQSAPDGASELRDQLRKAEADKDDPDEYVGKDQTLQAMIVHTAFSGDIDKDNELLAELDRVRGEVLAQVHDVNIGIAGGVAVEVAEHDSILNGMVLATAVTVTLVLAGMLWFFRSVLAVGALSWGLSVGTAATFAFTYLALGYLNLATAFLSSIVIGNGINVGILVTSRYLEELRAGRDGADALAGALAHTVAGTLAAALTAAVAYASLIITVFRGFRHFGIIGGVGILLCWVAAYTVLPAALSIARRLGMKPGKPSPLGGWLARLLPKSLGAVAIATIGLVVLAGAVTARYLAEDPFESNFKNLRSHSPTITAEKVWMHSIDRAFGEGLDSAFVIAVDRRDEVAPLVAELKRTDLTRQPRDKLFAQLYTMDDVLPADQPKKLEVLADIRKLLSSKDIDALDEKDRDEALRLRPPDDLHALTDADVPEAIAAPFIENDDSRGKLILATAGSGYEIWDAHDTVRFSDTVRALKLPADVHFGGASFIFADVLDAVLTDGPRATLASLAGAILVVLLVVGRNRHGFVTIVCGLSGTILMLGASALLGLKINFLDFVALPITIGIGIEYSVNIATRERQEGPGTGRAALATTGGAVFICSYTTIVGWGSLLLSQNKGINSFGLAAMIGEITCLGVALVLAPALLWLTAPKPLRAHADGARP